MGLTAVVTVVTVISRLIHIPHYGDVLGFVSLAIEATLGFPQFISNQKTKSVKGLSIFMIFSWFVGDFFKTVYFVLEVILCKYYRVNLFSSQCVELFSLQ